MVEEKREMGTERREGVKGQGEWNAKRERDREKERER